MRYELEIKNGNEWQTVAAADTTRALKKYATNMAATYRIWDLEKGPKCCYLDVTPTGAFGWNVGSCVRRDGRSR